jgi:molybdate transport system regulatory protein
VRVQFGSGFAIGPGKADLLQSVSETGSISAAARGMKMSYRRAWLLIDAMNQCFREPVVDTATGGKGGGGAQITPFGRTVLRDFRAMEAGALAIVAKRMPDFSRLLRKTPPAGKIY